MATLTTNLQLTKPELSDNITPTIFAENFDKIDTAVITTYVHNDSVLTGSGTNGKFKATSSGSKSYFTINNNVYNVRCGEETEIELVSGVWYSFILDITDKTINFNKGGTAVPDGETVLPVDDVKIWQKCAGLKAKYTTAAEILADDTYVTALMSTDNAVQYMTRSLSIQASVLANSGAIEALDSSLPFITPSMTSTTAPDGTVTASPNVVSYIYNAFAEIAVYTTAPSAYNLEADGEWIAYTFADTQEPVWLYKAQLRNAYTVGTPHTYKWQGLDENGVWQDLSDVVDGGAYNVNKDITLTTVFNPHTFKCTAIRIYKVGTNTSLYVNNGKVWGK